MPGFVARSASGSPRGDEPLAPPAFAAETRQREQVRRCPQAVAQRGAAQRREQARQQEVRLYPGPFARADADADVEFALVQVDQRHAGIQSHRKPRVRELESAQTRHQPGDPRSSANAVIASSVSARSMVCANAEFNRSNASSTAGASRWPAGVKHHLPRLALEQPQTQSLFELLDLVAHRRLGHVQLTGGTGETAQPRGGFERADSGTGVAAGFDIRWPCRSAAISALHASRAMPSLGAMQRLMAIEKHSAALPPNYVQEAVLGQGGAS